jgi:amino acid transporter
MAIGSITGAPTDPGTGARSLLKRLLIGRQMPSSRLSHTLLPKVLALPVFAADALSSVAYCVEASMLVLVGASASALHLVIPIQIGIATLMAIVVVSYRQTVRAYPTGGGSYIVSKDNLGVLAGLIAAAALLTDYVLTVSVSVAGGVLAVASAVPALRGALLPLSLAAVLFIAAMNLRGVRESGLLFAFPVYGFIVSILVLIGVGMLKCVHGCPQAAVPNPVPVGAGAVGLFVILHAFSSGSSALTGTEAISNGIRAFRRPQSRNAAATLTVMGVLAIAMIVGTAFLAARMHAAPSSSVSVISEIAKATFPGRTSGSAGLMFYVFQAFTFAILVLAANTSFQDFPRLSAILARDQFMPRQFENLGDRLVFSNGVFVLTALSAALLIIFRANVDTLIQLYVVGVFTAFTLSQAGMVRHWRALGRQGGPAAAGWRRRAVTNGVGSVATGLVTVIVIVTKFMHGAWIVIVAIPLIVLLFYAVRRHYGGVEAALRARIREGDSTIANTVVLFVPRFDEATARAVRYVRTVYGERFRAVHPLGAGEDRGALERRWLPFAGGVVPLEMIAGNGAAVKAFVRYVRGLPRGDDAVVTVVVPERLRRASVMAALRSGPALGLKLRLLGVPNVAVTNIPVVVPDERRGRAPRSAAGSPRRSEAIVLVSSVNDATLRAVAYARTMRVDAVRALCCVFDPHEVHRIWDDWIEQRVPVELTFVDAPFRDIGPPLLREVRAATRDGDAIVTVVVPELVVPSWRYEVLHNQRALYIKRLLLLEPNLVLTSLPYRIDGAAPPASATEQPAAGDLAPAAAPPGAHAADGEPLERRESARPREPEPAHP